MHKKDVLSLLPQLREEQWEVIIGSLLGDANVHDFRPDRNSYLTKTQSAEKVEYVRWHYRYLQPYSGSIRYCFRDAYSTKQGRSLRATESFVFSTHAHSVFTQLRTKWYPLDANTHSRKKRVPRDLKLTPRIIAIWFADDGSNSHRNRTIKLCSQGFPEEDVDFLIDGLRTEFHMKCKKQDVGNGYLIRFSAESYKDFLELIAPFFPWKCLGYKIDLSSYGEQPRNNTSGRRGVVWDKARNLWRAEIKANGRKLHLGRFATFQEAVDARQIAEEMFEVKVGRRWQDT